MYINIKIEKLVSKIIPYHEIFQNMPNSLILEKTTMFQTELLENELVSTEKERSCKPFWTKSTKNISNTLWLPTLTDCQEFDLKYYNGSIKNLITPSWYLTRIQNPTQKLNYPKITYQSLITSLPETEQKDLLKSKKIKLYPTTQQKQTLKYWFGANRWVYNQCNNYIKQLRKNGNNQIPSYKKLRELFLNGKSLKKFSNDTPYDIRDGGMIDVLKNLRSNLSKMKRKSIKHFHLKFKRLNNSIQSISVPHKYYGTKGVFSILTEIRKSDKIIKDYVMHDFRILKDFNGEYWMCLPVDKTFNSKRQTMKGTNNDVKHVISLDPGVRTFLTGYDPNRKNIINIGEGCIYNINVLCIRLDYLISRQTKAKNKKKVRLRKGIRRIRLKIKNRIKDMHYKVANFLCENYTDILLPKFETQKMVSNLHSKVARNMLNLSHYAFKMILLRKSNDYNVFKACKIHIVTEEYTSKTCGKCGTINKELGSSKEFKCPNSKCSLEIDRDANASRNILIKNL